MCPSLFYFPFQSLMTPPPEAVTPRKLSGRVWMQVLSDRSCRPTKVSGVVAGRRCIALFPVNASLGSFDGMGGKFGWDGWKVVRGPVRPKMFGDNFPGEIFSPSFNSQCNAQISKEKPVGFPFQNAHKTMKISEGLARLLISCLIQ